MTYVMFSLFTDGYAIALSDQSHKLYNLQQEAFKHIHLLLIFCYVIMLFLCSCLSIRILLYMNMFVCFLMTDVSPISIMNTISLMHD